MSTPTTTWLSAPIQTAPIQTAPILVMTMAKTMIIIMAITMIIIVIRVVQISTADLYPLYTELDVPFTP
jgi:hypothetical protein